MSLNQRLRNIIDRRPVPFEVLDHYVAFSAERIARVARVPGRLVAKPVIVREEDGRYVMAIVSAPRRADLRAIRRARGGVPGRLASEHELLKLFPDCEVGAMPPMGRLYGIPTFLDEEFREHTEIYFQAGNHRELVKMKFSDFAKIAGPFAGEFPMHREGAAAGG